MYQTYFNIAAIVPAGTSFEQFLLMQQNLLADRFKLAAHFEKKEMQIFELKIAKDGPKFKESPADPSAPSAVRSAVTAMGLQIDSDGGLDYMQSGGRTRHFRKQTMEAFAAFLTTYADRPVVDTTGLTGTHEIVLDFVRAPRSDLPFGATDGAAGPDADVGPSLARALQSQLGLQLEPKKAPVDVLIIDHIERTPTEN